MISCYELRIGNIVMAGKTFQQVSSITATVVLTIEPHKNGEQAGAEHSLEKLEPVTLTDDILKQCGFMYHDYFKFWQLITTDIRSEMDIDPDYDLIDFMRRPIIKKLGSLHQLQNAYFMLKGRELIFVKRELA